LSGLGSAPTVGRVETGRSGSVTETERSMMDDPMGELLDDPESGEDDEDDEDDED
jgi:hypothetical protein